MFIKKKVIVVSFILSFMIATITPQFIEAQEVIQSGDPSDVKEIVQNTTPIENTDESITQEASKKRSWVKYGSAYSGSNKAAKLTIGSLSVSMSAITKVPAAAKWINNIANLFYQSNKKTVYYSAQAYKDKNSPNARPTYKVNYTFYADKAHTKKKGSKSVIRSST